MKWTQVSRGEGSKISLGQKPGAAEPWWPCKESQFSRVRALPTISVEVRSRVGEDSKNFKLWAFVSAHSLKKKKSIQNKQEMCLLWLQGSQLPRITKNFSKLCILITSWQDYLLAFWFQEQLGRNVTRASKNLSFHGSSPWHYSQTANPSLPVPQMFLKDAFFFSSSLSVLENISKSSSQDTCRDPAHSHLQ